MTALAAMHERLKPYDSEIGRPSVHTTSGFTYGCTGTFRAGRRHHQHRTRAPQRVAYLFGHTLQRDHQYELRPIDIPAMADCSPQLF